MVFRTTTILSVSHKEPIDCRKMAEYLGAKGFHTSISTNTSTEPNIEYGCSLTQTMTEKKELETLWTTLKTKYNLTCAHVKVGNQFEGCILDFLAPSKCPTLNKGQDKVPNKIPDMAYHLALAPRIWEKVWGTGYRS